MRLSASWLVFVGLSFAACSGDDSGQSEDAVTSSDASTDESKDATDTKKSGSGGKAGSGKPASAGAGGSKAASGTASGEKGSSPDANGDAKKDEESKKDSKDSKDDNKPADGDKGKPADKPGDKPAGPDSSGSSDSDKPKENPGTSAGSSPAATGDQNAVCSRIEGDCNQGLACHAPAGPFSTGRGYCSKICRADADCSGLAPEGTKYTCSTGPGTSTCEVACSGADDKSCPASMVCVQTGVRPRPVMASDAGMPESTGDAGAARAPFEQVFSCRHAFETSKIWGACGDATHVCGEGLRCAGATWFGGAGHCTRACESDADCAKPESGSAKPTCTTLVPAFGDTAAVKQCVLSCSEAKDGCPTGLACFEGPQTRASADSEPMPAFAWCQ